MAKKRKADGWRAGVVEGSSSNRMNSKKKPYNGKQWQSIMLYRRLQVARLQVRGLVGPEILARLVEDGLINPNTGKPWDLKTIYNDIAANEREWLSLTLVTVGKHKARQLAELREARREAWKAGNVAEVRLNMATEMALLGTEAPTKFQEVPFDLGDFPDLEAEDVIAEARRILGL
jgi:hypothetical protein